MTELSIGFPPVARSDARVLILGSMPGVASLKASEYYAHTRNVFWQIMSGITGVDAREAYAQRIAALKTSGIALWDVLQSCQRHGSLDADIEADTLKVNDFAAFFRQHRGIKHVCFNGATAERYFTRYVLPELSARSMRLLRLPSTSPAHAALSFEQKRDTWRAALKPYRGSSIGCES